MKPGSKRRSLPRSPITVFALLLVVTISLWLVNFLLLYDHPERGVIGDMFGAVNAFFGGLALAGIIYTIIIQQKELAEARDRDEEQRYNLRIQTFENTFFQMLRLNSDIVNSIQLPGQRETVQGRGCFEEIYDTWLGMHYESQEKNNDSASEIDKINEAYLNFFKFAQAVIGHYFRHLYNSLMFIKNSDIENKQLYANLLKAHVSSYEIAILFYHCLSDIGKKEFKPLVEEFAFLQDVNEVLLFKPTHVSLYNKTAYGGE